MEKKKIFIFNYFMYIGGAERALLGLLNSIDYTKYDVDLFLAMHVGEFMTLIPKEVNQLPEDSRYAGYACPLRKVLFSKNFMIGLARLNARRKFMNYKKNKGVVHSSAFFQYIVKEMIPYLPKINPQLEYDLAISFIAPHNIVAEKVRARKKICWIHTDYSVVDVNAELELPIWATFDHVVSISDDVTKTFLQTFPSLESKIIKIENILSPGFVRRRAGELDVSAEMSKSDKTINLLSIGRYCYQKNFENIPYICKKINTKLLSLNSKLSIRWFLIGFGGDKELIRRKIAEAGMLDHVIILGKKSNPYPYIKACDIYVQPSRYEGKSVTVREAQMLCKPVVVTNYPTAKSQIQDGIDGKIVPMDNEECAQGLAEFIQNTELQKQVTEYLKTHDYGNETEVEKLYEIINEDV